VRHAEASLLNGRRKIELAAFFRKPLRAKAGFILGSRRGLEPPEDFFATADRGSFTELNRPNDGHVLKALAKGLLQQVAPSARHICSPAAQREFKLHQERYISFLPPRMPLLAELNRF
jgi:hypothetical protein